MNWIVKNNLFNRNILLHQHEERWVEAYEKENNVFCCKCDEEYPHKRLLTLLDIFPRPNNRSYLEIYCNFRKKDLKINPSPPNLDEWDEFGHQHQSGSWQPVLYQDQKICPNCLELAPERDFGELSEVENPEKYFSVKRKNENGEIEELKVQLV